MMMMSTSAEPERFPIVEAGDAEDVVLALETGRALWGQGDPREAVRWLRRAAEHAEESGTDIRALSLARVAADLTTLMQSPQTVPVPPTHHDDFADRVETPVRRASSLPPKLPPLPTPPERPAASKRPPAPSAVAKSSPSSAPRLVTPAPPAFASRSPSPTNGTHTGNSKSPSPPPQRTSVTPSPPSPSRPAGPRPTATTAESPVLQHAKAKRRGALRVSVNKDSNGDLHVDILDEGQDVPDGAIEALLVPLDPNNDLLR